MTGAARGEGACTRTSKTNQERLRERFRGSHGDGFDAAGEADLAKDTGGQVRVATSWQTGSRFGLGRFRAAEERSETQAEAFGQRQKDTGNTSNARLATVKATEGAGKTNDLLPESRGDNNTLKQFRAFPTPVNTNRNAPGMPGKLQRTSRFLPIG